MSLDEDKKRTIAAILIAEAGTDEHIRGYDPVAGMHMVLNSMINQAKVSKAKNKSQYMTETPSGKEVYDKATKDNNYSAFNEVDRTNQNLINGWTNRHLNKSRNLETKALELVNEFLTGNLPDIISGATHYYNPNLVETDSMPYVKTEHLFNNPQFYNTTSHVFGFDPMGNIEGKLDKDGDPVFTKEKAFDNIFKVYPLKFVRYQFKEQKNKQIIKNEILDTFPYSREEEVKSWDTQHNTSKNSSYSPFGSGTSGKGYIQ